MKAKKNESKGNQTKGIKGIIRKQKKAKGRTKMRQRRKDDSKEEERTGK